MSIIKRSNPLNLQYRVCIVTSASTALGVVICKTLLKANALVLGLDSRPKHDSLNAGLGTHFQFEQCNLKDDGVAGKLIAAAREKFGVESLDVLVNVAEEGEEADLEGLRNLTEVVGEVMDRERSGSIVNIIVDAPSAEQSQYNTVVGLAPVEPVASDSPCRKTY